MSGTISFNLAGGPGVRITVAEIDDGKLQITAVISSTTLVGDLRGLFFHVADQSLLGGLSVTGATSPVGTIQQAANAVSNLGAGVSIAGAASPMDMGIAFGTVSAAGADDIRSVSFTLAHSTEDLTLAFLHQVQFGAVTSSVGTATGPRIGTFKSLGTSPANQAPVVSSDSQTVSEDGSLDGSVGALASDPEQNDLQFALVGTAPEGLTFNPDGSYRYVPPADFSGPVSFQFKASDGTLDSAPATVTIEVTPVNDAPSAVEDAASTDEDQVLTLTAASLLANDSDVDGDTLSISAVGAALGGTVSLSGSDVTFTPTPNFNGAASFEYTVSDGHGGTDTATVAVTVDAVNDDPLAGDDAASTDEDQALTLTAASLLANDSDVDGDTLSISAVGAALGGTVSLSGSDVLFTPTLNFNGAASFEYTVSDGHGGSDTATVAVTINAVNDAPSATDDAASTDEDLVLTLTAASLLANDSDVDGDALSISAVGAAVGGTVSLSGTDVVFTPTPDFNGPASFEYTVSDGHGGADTATVAVTVDAVNDDPTDIALSNASIAENSATGTLVGLLSASDVDGGPASFSILGPSMPFAVVGNRLEVAGALDFESQSSYTFTIRADDGAGGSYDESFTISVTDVDEGGGNSPPLAGDDAASTDEDQALTLAAASLLANDSDVDGDALSISAVGAAVGGTVSLSGSDLLFTPTPNFNGAASFEYTVSDGHGGTDTATVAVTVNAVNDAPAAADDAASTDEDQAVTLTAASLLANDSDVDGDTLSISAVGAVLGGTVSLSGSDVVFTPTPNFNGAASFEYTVSDGHGGTDTATVAVTVDPVNDAPTAGDDLASTDEDQLLTLTVASLLANDSDVDGDVLSISAVGNALGGTVSLSGSDVLFTPTPNFNGPASFEYTVSDGHGGTDTATVAVTVDAVNDDPLATDDAASTDEDQALTLGAATLLANDSDVDGDALSISAVGNALGGTVSLSGTDVVFTPTPDFNGPASFEYTVSDGHGGADTATVAVTVDAVNDDPTDIALSNASIAENSATGTLVGLLSASDVDGGPASFSILGPSMPFAVVGNRLEVAGALDFESQSSYTFTIRADDGAGGSYDESFTISVTDVDEGGGNSPPLAGDDAASTDEDQALTLAAASLLANDSDVDGDALSISAVGAAVGGTVSLSGSDVLFTPTPNFNGAASFEYTVSDGHGGTDTATVAVTVDAVNDDPLATDDAASTDEDQALTLAAASLLANDSDVDGDTLSISAVGNALGGTVSLSGSDVLFTPTPDFNGPASFEYTVSDGHGGTDTATVAVTVDAVNDDPLAGDDAASTDEDQALTLAAASLLANDSDVDGDALSISAVGNAVGGTVSLSGSDVLFTPTPDFNGAASFEYTVSDGHGGTDTATVAVTVDAVNDDPLAGDDAASTDEDQALTLGAATLLANDSDVDGDTLSISAVGAAVGGTVSLSGSDVVFTPTPDFNGAASFEYTVSDGHGGTDTATVAVTVTAVNDPPSAPDGVAGTVDEDQRLTFTMAQLLAGVTDVDGDTTTVVEFLGGPNVVGSLTGGGIDVGGSADFNGSATASYRVSDGHGGFSIGQIQLSVTPVNDPPVVTTDTFAGTEDTTFVITVAELLAQVASDVDGDPLAVVSATSVHGGTVSIAGGDLSFTPDADFNATGWFWLTVSDGTFEASNWQYVEFTDVDDAPVAADDVITRQTGPQVIGFDALFANDTDIDSPSSGWTIAAIQNPSGVSVGVDNVARTVTVDYTPGHAGGYRFDYVLADGEGALASAAATVTLNDSPTAVDDVATVLENNAFFSYQFVDVIANDTDPNGDALTLTGVTVLGGAPIFATPWNASTLAFYSTDQDFFGTVEIDYIVSDGVASDTGRLTVTIEPQNDAPRDTVAVPGFGSSTDGVFEGTEETPLTILKADLLVDDMDPEGSAVTWNGAVAYHFGSSVVDNGDSITFTPDPNRQGATYAFYYYAEDEDEAVSQPIYVVVNLVNTPDPIVAFDDIVDRTGGPTQALAASAMVGNDTDPDPDEIRDIVSVTAVNGIAGLSLNADDSIDVIYAADGSYSGRASFDYVVQDATGHTDTARVTLNRVPTVGDDGSFTLNEGDNSVFIPYSALLGNDADADGDTLTPFAWDWGYPGSNVFIQSAFEGGEPGFRAVLQDGTYTGAAEFMYRAWDGNRYSELATVTLDVIAGNDAPLALTDYWFYNSTTEAEFDTNPLTNAMAGLEDQVLEFPASLLIDGQQLAGNPSNGADSDEEGQALSIVPVSLFSFYGNVELVDLAGEPTIRFTPHADVNSDDPFGGIDSTRVWFNYQVTDGSRESNVASAYVYLAGTDDQPVALDDFYAVSGGTNHWVLPIGDVFGPYDVRANDVSPDDYPYDFASELTTLTAVVPVSGISSLGWDGFNVDVQADGTGDPIVFEYTLQDDDGDQATAQVTLTPRNLGPSVFYFSGVADGAGRELWAFDPITVPDGFGAPIATMVDEAQTWTGVNDGNPLEITAVGGSAFWRGSYGDDFSGYFGDSWSHYNPNVFGFQDLAVYVAYGAFDETLFPEEQNLGIRSGHLFWGAGQNEGDALYAWDEIGDPQGIAFLGGYQRELLTDAGGVPAYAAIDATDDGTGNFGESEQLFGVLYNPSWDAWETLRVTDGGDSSNFIREINGLSIVTDEAGGRLAKTYYFAGSFSDIGGDAHHDDALWRVTLEWGGSSWSSYALPEALDNGSGFGVPSDPHDLTVADVPDGLGGSIERLFFFQTDAAGNGQIATIEYDHFGGSSGSTGSSLGYTSFTGSEIRPWADGVVLSGVDDDSGQNFVANWVDPEGDGFFFPTVIVMRTDNTIEQLVVDGLGGLAFVEDDGAIDTLWYYDGDAVWHVDARYGEITDVSFAEGRLGWIAESDAGGHQAVFGYDTDAHVRFEAETDETTASDAGTGVYSSYRHVAITDALAFEGTDGSTSQLYVTNGTDLIATDLTPYSAGDAFDGGWVGTGYDNSIGRVVLEAVDAAGQQTVLYDNSTVGLVNETAVLGDEVLFGVTSAATNEVRLYESATSSSIPILGNHLLGRAQALDGEIVFSALDFGEGTWKLYRYDGAGNTTSIASLPAGGGGGQPVYDYWRHVDFFGDADHLFWKQVNDVVGVEAHVLDRGTGVVTPIDVQAGTEDGGNWGDAVFANGRFFWQADTADITESMRLYTTTDGSDAVPVTGVDLLEGYQFPWLPTAIGDKVYFLGASVAPAQGGSGTWAVFEINSDGIAGTADDTTATQVSPTSFGYIYSLTSIGSDLFFFESENGFDQMWRMTPGSAPELLTDFTQDGSFMGNIFRGGDGYTYFTRSEAGTGQELWVLDAGEDSGARLVADINPNQSSQGYQPVQLIGVPDPLEPVIEIGVGT